MPSKYTAALLSCDLTVLMGAILLQICELVLEK